eukprot:m.263370 g.263370  ORF g.263370 m.263370 type:complete len:195 (+) comp26897_c0_seq1:45-629(+)
MFTYRSKVKKTHGRQPNALETTVASALYELQVNSEKLKQPLWGVHINAAKEVELSDGKKVVVIFVPVPQLPQYQKMIRENSLIDELEKKFSGKHVVVIAQRRIIRKETRSARQLKQKRPRSRTLTAVHDALLEDLVFPSEVIGRRIRFKKDGSRLLKAHLNQENKNVKDKLETFTKVYKALTNKDVAFEFPRTL